MTHVKKINIKINKHKLVPPQRKQKFELSPPKPQLYWAYGSNLNVENMKFRCPGAVKKGRLFVTGGRLVFRGVADVVSSENEIERIPGGLWQITRRCEVALDRYEGVAGGLYVKRYIRYTDKHGVEHRVLYYKMRQQGIMPPSEYYLNTIIDGYRDFGLPLEELDQAVQRSWKDKELNEQLRARHARKGSPKLAQPDHVPLEDIAESDIEVMLNPTNEEEDEEE